MATGIPELRIYLGDTLLHKEHAPLEALYDRAEQLRAQMGERPPLEHGPS